MSYMKKSNLYLLYLGVAVFSMTLGLLIGASNSPVVGLVISGIFGIGVAIFGFIQKSSNEQHQTLDLSSHLQFIGKGLILFSIFLLFGVYLGVLYRTSGNEAKKYNFVWDKTNRPASVYEALDWIRVNELLTDKGYTKDQIKEIYEIRRKELKDTTNDPYGSSKYSQQIPYYKILIESTQSNKQVRGPASE